MGTKNMTSGAKLTNQSPNESFLPSGNNVWNCPRNSWFGAVPTGVPIPPTDAA